MPSRLTRRPRVATKDSTRLAPKDVLLASVAGSIGNYLRDMGDDPTGKDIRALVPVNLRPIEDAWQLGNRFGLVPLLVP